MYSSGPFDPPLARTQRTLRPIHWAAFVLLAAHLLFAHGCHGDEDHELLGRLRALVGCGGVKVTR